ncbi:4Fe-4S binding protein [Thiovibrio frasassiensis]|uniref:4Fe-4S binding protein n=1 Tax=Thiovibrio frasassiensis TaxID=2984131 RepID=A0A9X4MF80_9BACT|nr:4Fe-4S binding protein [Thiovibrio frasassiensis]MDG4475203.1 4Fe-4S binding protein [Thiovibrio frasassiensis]
MSLADRLAGRFHGSEPPALELISRRCLRTRFQGSACARCVSECSVGAIRLEPGTVMLDPKRCVGCLACTAVCPAEALTGCGSRLAAFPGKVDAGKAVFLSCEKGVRTGEEIILPCLGALSEEHLVAFAARSGEDVCLNLGRCTDCRASFVPAVLARRLQALASKLGREGFISRIRLLTREEEIGQAASASRRSFFRAFWDLSLHAATETITTLQAEPDPKEKHAHKHQPARLVLLRQALVDSGDEAVRLAMLPLFFTLTVNTECNFCGGCAGMCPTGALKNIREEEGKQLQFTWARCSGCGLCLEFCPPKALSLSGGRSPDALGPECDVLLRMDGV